MMNSAHSSVAPLLRSLLAFVLLFCGTIRAPHAQPHPTQTQQTRPRRVNPTLPQPVPTPEQTWREETDAEAEAPETLATETPMQTGVRVSTLDLSEEPWVRIGLATEARAVSVSAVGGLLYATDTGASFAPLETARVRLEPRRYDPLPLTPPETTTADEAAARKMADGRGVPATAATAASVATATPERTRAGQAGRTDNSAVSEGQGKAAREGQGKLRLTSSVSASPVRGSVVYASGTATPLLHLRAPILFASADEATEPVRFNEKAYRGRLEIFANERGTLTVVNLVRLEDYVRGVVPNELSPDGYPAIEALKAQAVAARTYAVSNRGRFAAAGFDLLPTTRSQVYGGRQTEHALTDRAVAETRGRILTHRGQVINALYTSTCGGHTEDAEKIFGGETVPYLRAHECSAGHEALEASTIRTTRELSSIRDDKHLLSVRAAALLAINNFPLLPARLTDEWLDAPLTLEEVRALVAGVSLLARQPAPSITAETVRPPAFCTALSEAVDGERKGQALLNRTDVEYLLAFRDAADVPPEHRADVALFLREGHLSLYPDATLRPLKAISRARALQLTAHLLEARGLLRLQKATARPSGGSSLVLRPAGGKSSDRTLAVAADAFLFRAFGETLHQVRELQIVGGEPILAHTNARGEIDYLEARPAPNGAAADRFSPFTNWTVSLTPSEVTDRLGRLAGQTGAVVDLRVVRRGESQRVLDLQVTGTKGTAHIRGGRIRSALRLREQLFVIERRYDETGRLTNFVFTGRGWGHGVGMCQVGAYGLARSGWTYDKILKSYYTGAALAKLY